MTLSVLNDLFFVFSYHDNGSVVRYILFLYTMTLPVLYVVFSLYHDPAGVAVLAYPPFSIPVGTLKLFSAYRRVPVS